MANFEQHKTAQPAIAESDSWLFLKYFFSLHTREKILKIGSDSVLHYLSTCSRHAEFSSR